MEYQEGIWNYLWMLGFIIPALYFYLKRKINMIFLLDIIVVFIGLLILYILPSPHRIYGVIDGAHLIFR